MMKIFTKFKNYIFDNLSVLYRGPKTSFSIYWNDYGGFKSLFKSIYFFISIFLSICIVCVNYFCPDENQWNWCQSVASIIPCILGFSLGGYAFLVGFGNERFLSILCSRSKDEERSVYMKVSSSFFHFIFIQFLSLIFSVLAESLHVNGIFLIDIIGIFLFIYAIFTILSTSFAVLNLADWFDTVKNCENNKSDTF